MANPDSPTIRLGPKKGDSPMKIASEGMNSIDVEETQEGLINLNLTSSQGDDDIDHSNIDPDDRSQKTPSAFDASPWGEQEQGTQLDSSTI